MVSRGRKGKMKNNFTMDDSKLKKRMKRNSRVELLKVFAIVLIIISHSVPNQNVITYKSAIDVSHSTDDIFVLIMGFLKYFGQIGNDIFLIASCYFLNETNNIKYDKVALLLFYNWLISIIWLISTIFFKDNYSLII